MKYILTFLLCILKSIEIGHSVRCGWTPNRIFEAAIKESSFLNISVSTLPWIHVLVDLSTGACDIGTLIDFETIVSSLSTDLMATTLISVAGDSHLIPNARDQLQVMFDESHRMPISFIPVVTAYWNARQPKRNHYLLFLKNVVIYNNNIRPICLVHSLTQLQKYVSVWYCGGSSLNTQRICVRNLTLLDSSACSDAAYYNSSRACFQDNYEERDTISGEVIMASDGTYWYLYAYFDKMLPDVDDKPKNRSLYKLFEKHHLIKFRPKYLMM
ncbi:Trypsinogen-like protein [Trichinella pseudospiralis]